MRRVRVPLYGFLLLVAWFLAAPPALFAQESRLYGRGKEAFRDGLHAVAAKQFRELLEKFPNTSKQEEVLLLLAQSKLALGEWEDAATVLKGQLGAAKPPTRFLDGYLFWLAEALSKGKQYADAESQYRAVLAQFPKGAYAVPARYGLAWVFLETKRWDEALEAFGQIASAKDRASQELAPGARLAMGRIHLARGEHEKARTIFVPLAETAPPGKLTFEARYWLGQLAYERKEFDEALTHFEKIVAAPKVWPGWVTGESWSSIGWIHWHRGAYEPSAEAFARAIQTLHSDSKRRESSIQYGQCYLRLGKPDIAIEKLREFLQSSPQDALAPDVQMAIADIYLSQNMFEDAAREYAKLFSDFPQHDAHPSAHYWRGWALFELKKYDEAIAEFEQAAGSTRDDGQAAEALYKIGDAWWKLEQYPKAVTAYEAFLDKHPDHPRVEEARFQTVQGQLQLKNTSLALAALSRLTERFPDSRFRGQAYLQIGMAYVKEGLYAAARELYGKFLHDFPTSPLASHAMLDLGQAYYLEELDEEALEQFEKVIAADPPAPRDTLALARYRRGLCLHRMGRSEEAKQEFTDLIENFKDVPGMAEVQFRIGEFHLNRKDHAKAQEQFDRLQRNWPASPYADAALYWAGRAAFQRQGYNEATQFFQKLLDNYPASEWRPYARFGQADALIELGGGDVAYQNALVVLDQLIRDFKSSDVVDDAWGRLGDCQFTLKRYGEAIRSYRNVVESPTANLTQKNHARYQIGLCYEKLDQPSDAFEQYMLVVYDQTAPSERATVPESFWFCKAALAAASIVKQQDQWREAIRIYQRVVQANVTCSQEAQEQIRQLEPLILPLARP